MPKTIFMIEPKEPATSSDDGYWLVNQYWQRLYISPKKGSLKKAMDYSKELLNKRETSQPKKVLHFLYK